MIFRALPALLGTTRIRYNIIVCGETLQKCTYEWYDKYIHSWKKKFGAVRVLKGCSA